MTDDSVVNLSFKTSVKSRKEKDMPSPADGMRLLRAFSSIDDPARRAKIIEMAERMSALTSN